MTAPDQMLDDPFGSEEAAEYGLSPSVWRVSVDKRKTPYGRRVSVAVKHVPTGKVLTDTVVGSGLTKNDLKAHARRMVADLTSRLS